MNTDAQHLIKVGIDNKMLIGRTARGRGAGGDPEKGEMAAFESERALQKAVEDCDSGLRYCRTRWWNRNGLSPCRGPTCKDAGALTIAVVTYPFESEGTLRRQNAEWGLNASVKFVTRLSFYQTKSCFQLMVYGPAYRGCVPSCR